MKGFYIIIVAYNEEEYVELSVKGIRMFADVEDLSVIVIDNGSTDGLHDWAAGQTDITYVYLDEGRRPFGEAVNRVRKELQICGDMLIMSGGYLLTAKCLSNMLEALYEEERIGAVGPMSNGLPFYQYTDEMASFEETLNWTAVSRKTYDKRVMDLYYGAVLFRAECVEQMGDFDEKLTDAVYVIKDYCLRMILEEWKLKVCGNSFVWNIRKPVYAEKVTEQKLLEQKWGMHYFNFVGNDNLIDVIPQSPNSEFHLLEIGCDCGATLLGIQNRYPNAHVYGSEINESAVRIAAHFATVEVNNIEEQNLTYCPAMFDYIIFGDVLEHLKDPLETIKYCRTFLKRDGCIIASIPNLMHISVMEDLLNGNFTYEESGLLDKTHIHLFTYYEIFKMFQAGGYEIKEAKTLVYPISKEQSALIDKLVSLKEESVERFMYEAFQYIICAQIMEED